MPDKNLVHEVITHNGLNINDSEIKIVSRLKRKFNFDLVLKLSNQLRIKLLAKRSLYLDWQSCTIKDHIFIQQCSLCNLFGHNKKKTVFNKMLNALFVTKII